MRWRPHKYGLRKCVSLQSHLSSRRNNRFPRECFQHWSRLSHGRSIHELYCNLPFPIREFSRSPFDSTVCAAKRQLTGNRDIRRKLRGVFQGLTSILQQSRGHDEFYSICNGAGESRAGLICFNSLPTAGSKRGETNGKNLDGDDWVERRGGGEKRCRVEVTNIHNRKPKK